MSEDETRGDLGRESFKIHAVPCRQSGGEDARVRTERVVCVPADAKTVAIDGAACVEAETRVVRLGENGVGRLCYQLAEDDGLVALVDLKHLSRLETAILGRWSAVSTRIEQSANVRCC